MYQFYYGNALGQPGTILSFLCQPNTARGSRGTGQVISLAFVVAENALPFWADYLTRNGIVVGGPHQRFDTQALSFFDPDGLQIDLIAQRVTEERHIWQNGRIPPAYALRGLHSVSIAVAQYEATAMLLHRGLEFQQVAEEGNRRRYQAGSGLTGTLFDVVHLPSVPAGTLGAGIVHHVGWRTPGEAQQLAWGYRLNDLGLNVSPIVDHFYFRACYFRDPGGVLFAIATDTPGFLLDEPPEHLGTHLMLPPWLEQQRAQLVRTLPPLRLPTSTQGR
ncbi:MAG TPA: ring-cleaving dioxygenase, partial [Ktedonobacteraceae bacterium]|nr:ring-cleaving dioxygenase [Ktedonobacteraceae bacterium]